MARWTRFNQIYSNRDLHLIQQRVDVQPAEPKLNMIDIPGADGSKDLTEKPAGRVVYKNRKITWTFALYPGDKWDAKHAEVSNALNGLRCTIHLDTDWDWYYDGRLTVKKYNHDKALRQITVEATCFPYKRKFAYTDVRKDITAEPLDIVLRNTQEPVVPDFMASVQTTLTYNGLAVTIPPGAWFSSLDFELPKGESTITAQTVSGTGTLRILYREGSL